MKTLEAINHLQEAKQKAEQEMSKVLQDFQKAHDLFGAYSKAGVGISVNCQELSMSGGKKVVYITIHI